MLILYIMFAPSSLLWPFLPSVLAGASTDTCCRLYERAATSVGLDFLSHPFWDKYLEFEERLEAQDRIFAILDRLIHIPMHQYARYFERYRNLTQTQPITSLAPADIVAQFRAECVREAGPKGKNDLEMERDLRAKIDAFNMEVFHRTANETNKRWTYESEIKRPYFHVTELDETQIVNWRKYLDFEEVEGEYVRTQFLYERCMVTCAYYDEFWFRYARWMSSQKDKTEEVRNIYQRASCVYVPISRPSIRLHYAYFEESCDKVDIAIAIHEAILMNIPGHVETIISLANIHRRQRGFEAMVEIFKNYIDSAECSHETKGAILAEWAKATWVVSGDVDEARKIYQSHQPWYLGSRHFWIGFLSFELELPTSRKQETERHTRIKAVHDDMRQKSHLPVHIMKDLSSRYLMYLQERGGKEAIKEFVQLDMEIKGPFSIQTGMKSKLADDGSEATTQRRMVMENGHPGVEVNEAVIRAGGNPYTK